MQRGLRLASPFPIQRAGELYLAKRKGAAGRLLNYGTFEIKLVLSTTTSVNLRRGAGQALKIFHKVGRVFKAQREGGFSNGVAGI